MRTFEEYTTIIENLQDMKLGSTILQWNPNKTEVEFKLRIKQRTKLSDKEFYDVVQKGLNKVHSKLSDTGDSCIYFMTSKFILIVNKAKNTIVTIRDATWDKPTNGCNKKLIVSEDYIMQDLIDNVFFNETEFNGYSLNILTESDKWHLEVTHHCDVCLEVNL